MNEPIYGSKGVFLVGIKDVAKLAGVSHGTVSNIINENARVSTEKIRKVHDAIKELGYKANATARSLKTKRTKDIGIVLPNIIDSNFSLIFTGIERILSENGYTGSLYTTSEIPIKENYIIEQIHQKRMEGAIIITCQPWNINVFKQMEESNIKIVFVEREVKKNEFDFIEYNNYRSIFDVTTKYLNSGFRNICLVTGPKEFSSEAQCIDGYKDAYKNLNQKIKESFIKETNYDKESSFKIIMEIFQGKDSPEVLITSSTQLVEGALKVISILRNEIIKIPEIASLDEYSWSSEYPWSYDNCPTIIKILRRPMKIGELAAESLIDNIENPFLHEQVRQKINNNVNIEYLNREMDNRQVNINRENKVIKVLMMNSSAYKATKSLLPDFRQRENIDVRLDALPIVELYEKIYTESQKEEYDVFQIDIPWFAELADNGYIFKLDEFIEKYPRSISNFIPGVLDVYSKYNDKYYALPYMFGTQLLFYRKDLFEDLSIKNHFYELYHSRLEPPKTWKAFNVIAKFFTRSYNSNSPVEYGTTLGAKFPTGAICEFLPRLWAYGGNVIDDKGNLFLDERGAVKALKNYIESFNYASPASSDHFWEEEVKEFIQGKSAMMILFVAHATDISDRSKSRVVGKISYDIVPGGIPVLGGWSLGINNNSKKKKEAFKFIKWATGEEMAIPYTILGGFTPSTNLFKSSELLTIYPWLPKALESFTLSRRRTVSKVTTNDAISERDYEKIYGEAVVKSIKNQLSPEKSIEEANNRIRKIIMDNKK